MPAVSCGNCRTKHASAAAVRECYAERYDQERDYLAEVAAEARAERYWEDRGADDGFDEWEARRGVIQFSDAMAAAAAELEG